MQSARPVFLDLLKIRFPVTAIASILHRISGVVVFVGVPYLLYLLGKSTSSAGAFAEVQQMLQEPLHALLLWSILTGVGYHVVAGLRHILMDFHVGETLKAGRRSAIGCIVLGAVLSVATALWIWL